MKTNVRTRRHLALVAASAVLGLTCLPSLASAADGISVPIGEVTNFGQGCGDRALRTDTNSRPHIGNSNFHVVVTGAEAGDVVALVLGASNMEWSGAALPLDLGRIGFEGCSLYVSMDTVLLQGAGATPLGFLLPIPDSQSLLGVHVYAQSFAAKPDTDEFAASHAIDIMIGA